MFCGRKGYTLAVFCIFYIINAAECEKKGKRTKEHRVRPPQFEIHQSQELPSDKQITTFLYKGESRQYIYRSAIFNSSLSVTLTVCTSAVDWTISFKQIAYQNIAEHMLLHRVTFEGSETYHAKDAKAGLYILKLTATERDSFARVYISTEPGGSLALKQSPEKTLKLQKRQRRKRLTVRWNLSFVDPQGTDYCLVVSISKHYTSLCAAQGPHFEVSPSAIGNQLSIPSGTVRTWKYKEAKFGTALEEPLIACVGPRTHFTMDALKQNQIYFFDLFAINRQSNLTYLHGSASMLYDKRIKNTALKDGKAAFVNLKKLDGKAIFSYKVSRKYTNSSLELYIMPCGGAVDVEITLQGQVIESQMNIVGFGRILVKNPIAGARYYIRVLATNREELRKTSGVEVYATSKPSLNLPLPNVPTEPNVQEYLSLRRCDSVTIGWIPSPGQKAAYYCIVVKEGRIREMEGFKTPDQCGLENRLKKSADFFVKQCLNIRHDKEPVLIRKISQLRPGRNYIVQVTVNKPRGKTLSYDLLQVHTKPVCEHPKL